MDITYSKPLIAIEHHRVHDGDNVSVFVEEGTSFFKSKIRIRLESFSLMRTTTIRDATKELKEFALLLVSAAGTVAEVIDELNQCASEMEEES